MNNSVLDGSGRGKQQQLFSSPTPSEGRDGGLIIFIKYIVMLILALLVLLFVFCIAIWIINLINLYSI